MAQTIDAFISRLRAEGVEAAKKEAEEVKRQAQQEADQIIQAAKAEAQRLIEDAERQRAITLERTRTDLELAARDVVGLLRVTLTRALTAVLAKAVEATFSDPEFLKRLIAQILQEYAAAEVRGRPPLVIRIPEDSQAELRDWLLAQCRLLAASHGESDFVPEISAVLNKSGFEYKISSGTVEVTPEAVTQLLSQIVAPEIQAIIDRAVATTQSESSAS